MESKPLPLKLAAILYADVADAVLGRGIARLANSHPADTPSKERFAAS